MVPLHTNGYNDIKEKGVTHIRAIWFDLFIDINIEPKYD